MACDGVSEMRSNAIGELNEQPLHAALKNVYAGDTGLQEVRVRGFIVDVFRDGECIEIQTGNFSGIREKLSKLVRTNHLRLVFPIVIEKWLLKLPRRPGDKAERRKSPKKETLYHLFNEFVAFPELILNTNFSLECVEVVAEEVRKYTSGKAWRTHGWVPVERRLLDVCHTRPFPNAQALETLLPRDLPGQFTTADLASMAGIPKWLSQKTVYCYRKMRSIQVVGKQGRFNLYRRSRQQSGNGILG